MPTQRGAFYKGVFQSGHCKKIIFPCFRETLFVFDFNHGKSSGKKLGFLAFHVFRGCPSDFIGVDCPVSVEDSITIFISFIFAV